MRRHRRFSLALSLIALSLLGAAGCGAAAESPPAAPAPATPAGPVVEFSFTALDGSKFSTETSLGRNTVIAFVTSYGGSSQAQARFLSGVAHDHVPRTNCYAVFTERADNRPLVEIFVETLNLRLPVAHVEYEELKGGPFADVEAVPTVIILDRGGRVAWRKNALATQDEIDKELRRLED